MQAQRSSGKNQSSWVWIRLAPSITSQLWHLKVFEIQFLLCQMGIAISTFKVTVRNMQDACEKAWHFTGSPQSEVQRSFTFPTRKEKKVKSLSHVQIFATPWTIGHQVPPSMEFSWHKYWSGLPFPSSGDLPDRGIEPRSPALQVDILPSEPP